MVGKFLSALYLVTFNTLVNGTFVGYMMRILKDNVILLLSMLIFCDIVLTICLEIIDFQ